MDFYECKREVKRMLPQYLENKGINIRRNFQCLNPDHHDNHPSMGLMRGGERVHCLSCGATYDLIDLVGIDYGLNASEATKMAFDLYGLSPDRRSRKFYITKEEADLCNIHLPEGISCLISYDEDGFINYQKRSFSWNQFISEEDMKKLVLSRAAVMLDRLKYSKSDVEEDFRALLEEYPGYDKDKLYRICRRPYDKIDHDRIVLKKLYSRAKYN